MQALSDVSIDAAAGAITRSAYARDKRAQVWSAVNHLEQAEAAIKRQLTRRRGTLFLTSPQLAVHQMYKRQYILCLLAACYWCLGEDELTGDALYSAKSAQEVREESLLFKYQQRDEQGLNIADIARGTNPSYKTQYKVDVIQFSEVLLSRPMNETPTSDLPIPE